MRDRYFCPPFAVLDTGQQRRKGTFQPKPRLPIIVRFPDVYVPVSDGRYTVVDWEDAGSVVGRFWSPRGDGYPVTTIDGRGVALHHLIAGRPPAGKQTDHEDLDILNNRRRNLRHATKAQNVRNVKCRSHSTTGLKGVRFDKRYGTWQARITVSRRPIHLGTYSTKEDAARVYDDAAREHFGEFARLNFPRDGERSARDARPA